MDGLRVTHETYENDENPMDFDGFLQTMMGF